jgi:hypothetical protein
MCMGRTWASSPGQRSNITNSRPASGDVGGGGGDDGDNGGGGVDE